MERSPRWIRSALRELEAINVGAPVAGVEVDEVAGSRGWL
jgi:hypothetical protein